jgi:hypothetical protein
MLGDGGHIGGLHEQHDQSLEHVCQEGGLRDLTVRKVQLSKHIQLFIIAIHRKAFLNSIGNTSLFSYFGNGLLFYRKF